VEAGSPAQAAGIQTGDRIVSIEDKEKPKWEHVELRILINGGHTIPVVLNRNGQTIETSLTPVKKGPSDAGYAGMRPENPVTNIIAKIEPDKPAAKVLLPGDEIIAVNGINLEETGKTVSDVIQSTTGESFPLTIKRAGETKEFTIAPILQDGRRIIGISGFRVKTVMVKENFLGAMARAIDQNVEYGTLIFRVLGKLVTRDISPKAVDGPLRIMQQTSEIAQFGMAATLQLMAMISLNLGLMNLLPIPILDGGVMLLLLVEGIMRQELSLAFKERIVQVSFVFLLTLMVFVLYNDVVKMLPTAAGP
jgi:regulator of sigma E protease